MTAAVTILIQTALLFGINWQLLIMLLHFGGANTSIAWEDALNKITTNRESRTLSHQKVQQQ